MQVSGRSFVIEFVRWCLNDAFECNWEETRFEGLRRIGVSVQDDRKQKPSFVAGSSEEKAMREAETGVIAVGTTIRPANIVLDIPETLTLIDESSVPEPAPVRAWRYIDARGNLRLAIVTRRFPGPKEVYVLLNAIAYVRYCVHLAHPANGVAVYDLAKMAVVGEAIHHVPFARDSRGALIPNADKVAYAAAEDWLNVRYPGWDGDPTAYWDN